MVLRGRYFHGGVPGLRPGDVITPAAKTGTLSVSGKAGALYRRDRVYITNSEAEARDYAKLFVPMGLATTLGVESLPIEDLGGAVYEVEPRGPIEPDPDTPKRGASWQVVEAEVVRVVDDRVMPDFAAYMPPEHADAAARLWASAVGALAADGKLSPKSPQT
jgi:hypothetical protein